MENKQVATVRTITGSLIGGFLLYGIVFGMLYSYIHSTITNMISEDSLILLVIITIVLQGITVFCVWRCSIATTFSKRLINKNDVKIVIKNLMIFTVIIFFLFASMQFVQLNKTLDSNASVMMPESYMHYLYNDEEISQYQAKKQKIISEVKIKVYTYLIVLDIGLLAVYLGVVPLQRKEFLKHAV